MSENLYIASRQNNQGGGGTGVSTLAGTFIRKTRIAYSSILARDYWYVKPPGLDPSVDGITQLSDYKTTTTWTIDQAQFPSPEIVLTTQSSTSVSPIPTDFFRFIGFAGVAWRDGSVSIVNVSYRTLETDDFQNLLSFDVSQLRNNQPVIVYFDEIEASEIVIQFETVSSASLELALIYAGGNDDFIEFPHLPDQNFQPALWNSLNAPRQTPPLGNSFAPLILTNQGNEEVYRFSNLPADFLYSDYRRLVKSFRFYPVFSQWNSLDFPTQVIFGRMNINRANYSSGTIGSTSFRIRGSI